MSQSDIPIAERRRLYNQLGRRLKSPDMAPGLLEQYLSAGSNKDTKRWEYLKAFIVDKSMTLGWTKVRSTTLSPVRPGAQEEDQSGRVFRAALSSDRA